MLPDTILMTLLMPALISESVFEDMSGDELLNMLNNVNMSDPAQADSAIGIVDTIISGVETTTTFSNKFDTSTTEASSNEKSTTTIITTQAAAETTTSMIMDEAAASTPEDVAKEAQKIYNLLKLAISLVDTKGLTETLSPRDFEIRFVRHVA